MLCVDAGADDVRLLAAYARSLEDEVATYKPKAKSAEEIEAEANKIRSVLVSGIKKQMSVSAPHCNVYFILPCITPAYATFVACVSLSFLHPAHLPLLHR
jgi:hypothetical protein